VSADGLTNILAAFILRKLSLKVLLASVKTLTNSKNHFILETLFK